MRVWDGGVWYIAVTEKNEQMWQGKRRPTVSLVIRAVLPSLALSQVSFFSITGICKRANLVPCPDLTFAYPRHWKPRKKGAGTWKCWTRNSRRLRCARELETRRGRTRRMISSPTRRRFRRAKRSTPSWRRPEWLSFTSTTHRCVCLCVSVSVSVFVPFFLMSAEERCLFVTERQDSCPSDSCCNKSIVRVSRVGVAVA